MARNGTRGSSPFFFVTRKWSPTGPVDSPSPQAKLAVGARSLRRRNKSTAQAPRIQNSEISDLQTGLASIRGWTWQLPAGRRKTDGTMLSDTYDALIEAGASEAKAKAAAQEVAYPDRRLLRLQVMLGINITITLAIAAKHFT